MKQHVYALVTYLFIASTTSNALSHEAWQKVQLGLGLLRSAVAFGCLKLHEQEDRSAKQPAAHALFYALRGIESALVYQRTPDCLATTTPLGWLVYDAACFAYCSKKTWDAYSSPELSTPQSDIHSAELDDDDAAFEDKGARYAAITLEALVATICAVVGTGSLEELASAGARRNAPATFAQHLYQLQQALNILRALQELHLAPEGDWRKIAGPLWALGTAYATHTRSYVYDMVTLKKECELLGIPLASCTVQGAKAWYTEANKKFGSHALQTSDRAKAVAATELYTRIQDFCRQHNLKEATITPQPANTNFDVADID